MLDYLIEMQQIERVFRATLIWLLYLSVPVSLLTLVWGLRLILDAAGLFVFLACSASVIVAVLGIYSLLDSRQPRNQWTQRDQ